MIACRLLSYGQLHNDSLVCFTIEQAREINERVTLYPVLLDEIENYIKLDAAQQKQIAILKPQIAVKDEQIKILTAKLNNTEAKAQQLKRRRFIWGAGGVVAGMVLYGVLIK